MEVFPNQFQSSNNRERQWLFGNKFSKVVIWMGCWWVKCMTWILCIASTALHFSGIHRWSSWYAFTTGLLRTETLQKWSGRAGKGHVGVVACSVGKEQQKSGLWLVVVVHMFVKSQIWNSCCVWIHQCELSFHWSSLLIYVKRQQSEADWIVFWFGLSVPVNQP